MLNFADVPVPSAKPELDGVPASSVTLAVAISTTRTTLKASRTKSPPAVAAAQFEVVVASMVSKPAFVPTPTP